MHEFCFIRFFAFLTEILCYIKNGAFYTPIFWFFARIFSLIQEFCCTPIWIVFLHQFYVTPKYFLYIDIFSTNIILFPRILCYTNFILHQIFLHFVKKMCFLYTNMLFSAPIFCFLYQYFPFLTRILFYNKIFTFLKHTMKNTSFNTTLFRRCLLVRTNSDPVQS